MNIHKNARTTRYSRAEMVRRVTELHEPSSAVATAFGVSTRTVAKWLARYRAEGEAGLADRPSRPHRLRKPTPPAIAEQIAALRRQRITGKQIAITVGVSPATVSRVLNRLGLSRLRDLEPAEPVRRYEREHPGELIHIDIKKLGRFERVGHRITGDRQSNSRGVGWEFVHVCIDDASRVAFIQTSLREWAYATAYPNSDERKAALKPWLHNYNWHRPHRSLNSKTPISRLGLERNNLLRLHS